MPCHVLVVVTQRVYSEICWKTYSKNSRMEAEASLELLFIGPTSPRPWKFCVDVCLEASLKDPLLFPSGDAEPAWQVHSAGWRNSLKDRNRLKCRINPASWKTISSWYFFPLNSWWLQQSERVWFIIFGDLLLICLGVYWHEGRSWTLYPTEFPPSCCLFANPRAMLSWDIFIIIIYGGRYLNFPAL